MQDIQGPKIRTGSVKENTIIQKSEEINLTNKDLDYLRNHYLEILRNNCDNKNAKILIDKFPFQTVCLPLINLLFPKSKIIFTHRNPYDTVLSCFQQSFEPNNAMSNFCNIESAAKIYNLTMEHLKLYY